MSLPSIVQAGTPVLRARAQEVPLERIRTPELQELFATMIATMRAAPGVGLAAPQIGIAWRVVVPEDRDELQHEVDHLDGTLYVDRMKTRSFATAEQAKATYAGKPIAEVRRMLGL